MAPSVTEIYNDFCDKPTDLRTHAVLQSPTHHAVVYCTVPRTGGILTGIPTTKGQLDAGRPNTGHSGRA